MIEKYTLTFGNDRKGEKKKRRAEDDPSGTRDIYSRKRITSEKLCACLLTVRNRPVNRGKRASAPSLWSADQIHMIEQRGPATSSLERLELSHL